MRRGITSGRGGEIDVVAPLAAVLDEDNDKGIKVTLPAKPSLTIESSAGNFQHIYIFNTPPADAKQMFAALHVAAGGESDGGTKTLNHPWRLAGCANWPNKRKLNDGRSPVPQPVKFKGAFSAFIDVVDLRALLQSHWREDSDVKTIPSP